MTKPWFDPTEILIDGRWRPTAATLPVEDPSTGEIFAEIGRGTAADVDEAVAAAEAARLGAWGRLTATERGRILTRIGQAVLDRAEELAVLESRDVGKPLKQARADALALARYLEFYGGAADKIMGETIPYLDGYTVWTLREPHGVTGHIVPWNYPMQIIGRSVGAALAMGNAAVLKPAEEASLTALAFARIAMDAGLHYVYTGNVRDSEGGTTFCPSCHAALIERDGYTIRRYDLPDDGRCPHCRTPIAGHFGRFGKPFGAQRIPVRLARR